MADIFQEVDEDIRRERLKGLWDRYATYIIAVMVLLIVGVGGWRAYQWWELKQAAENGAAFESAIVLANDGKTTEAEAALSRIAADGTSGYRVLARFREAAALATRDPMAATGNYEALAADSSIGTMLQDLARVRAGLLLIDTASYDDVRTRLEPATGADRPFRHTARELLAFSAWRQGDGAASRQWSDMIVADQATPPSIRSRIDILLAVTSPAAGT